MQNMKFAAVVAISKSRGDMNAVKGFTITRALKDIVRMQILLGMKSLVQ